MSLLSIKKMMTTFFVLFLLFSCASNGNKKDEVPEKPSSTTQIVLEPSENATETKFNEEERVRKGLCSATTDQLKKDDPKPKQEFQISDEPRSITKDSIENQRSIAQEKQENPLVESSEQRQYLLEQIFKYIIRIQVIYKDPKIEGFKLWSMAKYIQTKSAIENNLKFAFSDSASNGIARRFLLDDLKMYVNKMDSYLKKIKK